MRLLDMDLTRKLPAISASFVVGVFGLGLVLFSHYLLDHLERSEIAHLERETQLIIDSLTSYERSIEERAGMIGRVFAADFDPVFTIDTTSPRRSGESDVPVLRNRERELNDDFTAPDHLLASTGAVSSIFVRQGDEFVRISTSLKNEKGERSLGTRLSASHPAVARLLADQAWTGRVSLFGGEWMAHYLPARDQSGKVIGSLAIAVDFSAGYATLKEQIKKITIGETGYVFAVDGKAGAGQGQFVIHPKLEGKKVSEIVGADGQPIFQRMLERKTGLLRYAWRGEGGASVREKITVYRFFEPWQWLIAAGSYREEFLRQAHVLTAWTIAGTLFMVAALVVMLYLLVRRLVGQPLHQLQAALAALAAGGGDLTLRMPVQASDEVGRLAHTFNTFLESLQAMVGRTAHAAANVSGAADGLARFTAAVTEASSQQSSAAASAAAAVEEMAASIASVADSARQVRAQALAGGEQTRRSNSELHTVVGELSEVGEAVRRITATVEQFVGNVASITDLTQRVKEIADQTNLLALNAAIEAARAGESGRGFAVVADEVRKLAEKSTRSAREIDALTIELGQQSSAVDEAIRLGQAALSSGLGDLQRVAGLLESAGEAVDAAGAGVSTISDAVRAQTTASAEIAGNIATIARMSDDSVHSLRKADDDVHQLDALATALRQQVERFKT